MYLPDLSYALMPGRFELWNGEMGDVWHVDLGTVQLPTGVVVACDPFAPYAMDPFVRRIAPGKYPVRLALLDEPAPLIAAATIIVQAGVSPSLWEMAIVPGDDLADLRPGDSFGYAVDCGAGCFMDASIAAEYSEHLATLHDQGVVDELLSTFDRQGRLLYELPGTKDANVAMFRSGHGDGVFTSYFGLDGEGKVVCLTTHFEVVGRAPDHWPANSEKPEQAKKPWWRFW